MQEADRNVCHTLPVFSYFLFKSLSCSSASLSTRSFVAEACERYSGSMKTTIDIPEKELADAMRFTQAKTKRDAVLTALAEFNHRRRMATLVRHLGTCKNLMTPAELEQQRRQE